MVVVEEEAVVMSINIIGGQKIKWYEKVRNIMSFHVLCLHDVIFLPGFFFTLHISF